MPSECSGIGLACEDSAHERAVRVLVGDRLAVGQCWLDLDAQPLRAHREGRPYTSLTHAQDDWLDLQAYSRKRFPRTHGLFRGRSLAPEADLYRTVALLFHAMETPPAALVVVRDLDGRPERVTGFAQIRDGSPLLPFRMVLAAPQPEVEAWTIAGFVPADAAEAAKVKDLGLFFSPISQSERLTSSPNDALTDAKRVSRLLLKGDRAREEACLRNAGEAAASGRGPKQLMAFVADLDAQVVPLFHGVGPG